MKYLALLMIASAVFGADKWTEKELKSAAKRYKADIADAKKRYARKLETVKLWAMKKGDLDTAQAVAKLAKSLGTQTSVKPTELPKGAWWMILDYPDGKTRRHTVTFGSKIVIDGRILKPMKTKKGLLLVDEVADWAQLWVSTKSGYDIQHWGPAETYNSKSPIMKGKASEKARRLK